MRKNQTLFGSYLGFFSELASATSTKRRQKLFNKFYIFECFDGMFDIFISFRIPILTYRNVPINRTFNRNIRKYKICRIVFAVVWWRWRLPTRWRNQDKSQTMSDTVKYLYVSCFKRNAPYFIKIFSNKYFIFVYKLRYLYTNIW